MRIVIFGASGKTGSILVEQALEKGHQVIAYVRKANSISTEHRNLKIIVGNLNESLKMNDAINGADACISALGGNSLTRSTPEIVEGIACIVKSMELCGVARLMYISSIGAGKSRLLMPQPVRFLIADLFLRVPLADHNINEKVIENSKLNWTLVRPGGLTEGDLNENYKFGTEIIKMKGNKSISRKSVASFILKQIENEALHKKAVWIYE